MASSSGNSPGSTQPQNSGSEGGLQVMMDQRKRKRMQSNRESARRSRMRKQKHLDDLMGQVTQIRTENNQILTTINLTAQQLLNVEAENSVLGAQMAELTHRLDSLNDILAYMNNSSNTNCDAGFGAFPTVDPGFFPTAHPQESFFNYNNNSYNNNNNPWSLMYLNQQQPIPIMADMFQY